MAHVPHHRAQWLLLGGLGLMLAAAGALQVLPARQSVGVKREAALENYFPRSISGWKGEDQPLGETDSVIRRVKSLLHFDEAFLRSYRREGREFSLYVAYWKPGKMPARDVAFHIPDQCFAGVGWKRTAADYRYQRAFDGRLLAPAQYREFDAPGDHLYVLYWHILDGATILYSADGPPSQLVTLKSLLRHGMRQKGEQYFIRLTSRTPPDQLWGDDGFQAIMELVAPLGPGLHSGIEPY